MKKIKVHLWEYSTHYPISLFVACTDDLERLSEYFEFENTTECMDTSWDNAQAFTYYGLIEKSSMRRCILVVYRNLKTMTFPVIVHEARHVTQRIWETIGEDNYGIEADAYLTEWAAVCMNNCRLEVEKLNKKNKKK